MSFAESFEDTKLMSRGWYDGDRFTLSDDAVAGKYALQYGFAKGKLPPSDSSGLRHLFEPSEIVFLRFHLKLPRTGRGRTSPMVRTCSTS
jgi:hypothetical protein